MPTQSPEWIATARLLRRTGFGTTGAAVDAALELGTTAYLDTALRADPAEDPGAKATPVPTLALTSRAKTGDDRDAKQEYQAKVRADRAALTAWWLRRMAASTQPLPERLTFQWHHHFSTSLAKVRIPALMLQQNQTLRARGRGDFRDLALAMLTDPAMIRWLDGHKSTKASPNENLSREFMELFALGKSGGYTEQDVKEGARALTGWTITPQGEAVLRPARHDRTSKTVLGVTGDLDQEGFADAVLARPESARYLATRLWQQLVTPDVPSAAALDRLVAAYGKERDLTALLRALYTAQEFTAAEGSMVAGPLEWAVGAVRALKVPLTTDPAVKRLAGSLRALGQLPFYPPSVGGWPAGQAWLSTAALQERMRFAQGCAAQGDLGPVEEAGRSDRLDATAHLLGIGGWSDRSAKALTPSTANPQTLVAVALNTAEYLVH